MFLSTPLTILLVCSRTVHVCPSFFRKWCQTFWSRFACYDSTVLLHDHVFRFGTVHICILVRYNLPMNAHGWMKCSRYNDLPRWLRTSRCRGIKLRRPENVIVFAYTWVLVCMRSFCALLAAVYGSWTIIRRDDNVLSLPADIWPYVNEGACVRLKVGTESEVPCVLHTPLIVLFVPSHTSSYLPHEQLHSRRWACGALNS